MFDQLYITDLSIPGSHDAGTLNYGNVYRTMARCQFTNLTAQLQAGVRYIDVRLPS